MVLQWGLLLLRSSGLLGGYCERKTHLSEWGESGKKVTHNNFSISSFWLFCYVQRVVRSPPQPHTHSRRRLNIFSPPTKYLFHPSSFLACYTWWKMWVEHDTVDGSQWRLKRHTFQHWQQLSYVLGFLFHFSVLIFHDDFFSAVYSLWNLSYLSRMCWRLIYEYYELLTHEFWVNECEKIYMTEGWTAPKGAQKEQKTRTCETEAGKT